MLLAWANELAVRLFQLMSLGLNIFLCVDLVRTLWSPFEAANKRLLQYVVISFALSTLCIIFIWFNEDRGYYLEKIYFVSDDNQTSNLILAITLSAYIIVALYSMIFSIRRLNRPGVGPGVRKLFQKKHSAYVTLFIVIWTIQLSANYCHLFNPSNMQDTNDPDI